MSTKADQFMKEILALRGELSGLSRLNSDQRTQLVGLKHTLHQAAELLRLLSQNPDLKAYEAADNLIRYIETTVGR